MTTGQAPAFAAVMLLTGIGVPVLAALNAGLGTRLGHPMAASVILFALALLIAVVFRNAQPDLRASVLAE